jgi:polyhydroxyalkanoate synthesis regulator phasin
LANGVTAQTATGATAPATPGAQPQRGPRPGGAPLGSLIGAGTITADQARAVRDQLRTDAQAARAQARATALDTLVSEGELTQAQADAIAAAGRGGLRALVASGTLTADQARAVQAEFNEYGSVDTSAASLAALVASGVLTQEQADAIAALIPAPGTRS